MMKLDPRTTALVMIDLQNGVLGRPLLPHPATELLESATKLAGRFRYAGAAIVWVRACWSPDLGDSLRQPVDQPLALPAGGFPADFATFPGGPAEPSDLIIRFFPLNFFARCGEVFVTTTPDYAASCGQEH